MENVHSQSSTALTSNNAAQTELIGRTLGAQIRRNLVIALKGTLGAGKTTLTRGLAAGLGIDTRVTSPTFTLIHEYVGPQNRNRLYHMDTYRLGDDVETVLAGAETLGLEEILDEVAEEASDGVTVLVIEWADRLAPLLPADHLEIQIEAVDAEPEQRTIRLVAHGVYSAEVMRNPYYALRIQSVRPT
ncbi:tRNA (adenosine(37)-N6)-threonylcarbamoyltransferase complex ATPase subunit type 1 TsaE [bacterium]|nr:tRNA (adenosine(37)-N6)-threonylcarbamoyltransferase complex ATPase subunit type 1 TsaE [bacterium]